MRITGLRVNMVNIATTICWHVYYIWSFALSPISYSSAKFKSNIIILDLALVNKAWLTYGLDSFFKIRYFILYSFIKLPYFSSKISATSFHPGPTFSNFKLPHLVRTYLFCTKDHLCKSIYKT